MEGTVSASKSWGEKNYINGKLTNSRKEDVADLLVMVNNYHPSQKPTK